MHRQDAPIDRDLRVVIVQPSLAKYRIPVFRELASRPGIDLRVVYGERPDLANVEPDGFKGLKASLWKPSLLGQPLLVHPAQWSWATKRCTDVVVFTWTPRYLTLIPALIRARLSGVRTVLWGHGFSKTDRWLWRTARHKIGSLADCLLFYDRDTAKKHEEIGWPADQLFVAPNAIENTEIEAAREEWLADPGKLAQFRDRNALGDGPVLLFVSRLDRANRVDLLVEATERLARDFPTLRTVIIGNGDSQRGRLQALADERGVSEHIVFKKGIYEERELAPWFLSASLFCYPENIGLSILHAFWYGLPVVTSDRRECHNPEIAYLEEGVNGTTYEHGEVESLRHVLRDLLNNKDKRSSMATEARASVEGRVTVERMVDGLVSAARAVVLPEQSLTEPD